MSDMLRRVVMMMGKVTTPPTYTTWNPSDKTSNVALSGGNLVATTSGFAGSGVRSVIGKSSGKWYWEITITTMDDVYAGVSSSGGSLDPAWYYTTGMGWSGTSGSLYKNNTVVGSPGTYTTGNVLGFALDMGAGTLELFKNNVSAGSFSSLPSGTLHAVCGAGLSGGSGVITANFGASALTYAPPSGYNAGLYV